VLVHVGAPKTGTTFVQDLLFRNRADLADLGILFPAERFDAHFLSALDLMELSWGGLERHAVGTWDHLAEQVREWPAASIVSHEILARASRQQARRAIASFGDAEVHVVLSARDLVRQIPAEWQENVKHRRTLRYGRFLERIMDPARRTDLASWFWGVQEVPDILDRWGSTLEPSHVHLVTVPPRDAPPGLLWERFASVFALDPEGYDTASERSNRSLGVPETAFIRHVNSRVNRGVLENVHYREFVRELLAHQTLSRRADSPRLGVPDDVRAWATALSEQWVDVLKDKGYDVVGTLDDLVPPPLAEPFVDPDRQPRRAMYDVSMQATVTLLREAARLRLDSDRLAADLATARAERDAALRAAGPVTKLKRRIVAASETRRYLRWALDAYRRLRRP
jgi:hypothetical protein